MDLLVMAHRAEARFLLESGEVKHCQTIHESLYFLADRKAYLLLCGEGISAATVSLTQVLSRTKDIERVINLGIAGSLNPGRAQIGEIYSIRTVYLAYDNSMEYKSFSPIPFNGPMLDCVSTHQRALNREHQQRLAPFGDLIDREAWALAYVAHQFKIPFSCFKLVSDNPGEEENKDVLCQRIRQRAPYFSRRLSQFYCQHLNSAQEKSISSLETLPEGFYFTTAQKNLFLKTMKQLVSDEVSMDDIFHKVGLEELRAQKILPKDKTKILLERLMPLTTPLMYALQQKFQELALPFSRVGVNLRPPKNFEDGPFQLIIEASSEEEFHQKLEELRNLSLKKAKDLIDGAFDV